MTFKHTFGNGETMTMTWDLSACPATVNSDPVPKGISTAEYSRWVTDVVFPAVHEALSEEQREAVRAKGRALFQAYFKNK